MNKLITTYLALFMMVLITMDRLFKKNIIFFGQDPKSRVEQLWKLDDITKVKYAKKKGMPTCACWWNTFDGDSVAVVGTKVYL